MRLLFLLGKISDKFRMFDERVEEKFRTKNEKENPKIISGSRRKRISQGAGVDVFKINKLLKQFKMMSDMMKKMSQGKKIPSEMIPDEMLNKLK